MAFLSQGRVHHGSSNRPFAAAAGGFSAGPAGLLRAGGVEVPLLEHGGGRKASQFDDAGVSAARTFPHRATTTARGAVPKRRATMARLRGQVAVVTGASRGAGRA